MTPKPCGAVLVSPWFRCWGRLPGTAAEPRRNRIYEEIRRQYVQAYSAGYPARIADTFTQDAVMLPPDGPVLNGRVAIQAFYEGQFRQFTPSSMTINADEELVHGDWGYGAGSWEVTATMNATGVPFNLNGKFLHVAKRQADGAWKLYRHAWNAPTQYAALAATQG